MTEKPVDIVIAGAGSIGCFLGGALALAGRRVALLARQRVQDEIAEHGLTVSDFSGMSETIAADDLVVTTDPSILGAASTILVTVKSAATAEIGGLINEHGREDATVVSFQNGVSNADTLRGAMTAGTVVAGMVPFNVVSLGEGKFHRGTSGELAIAAGHEGLADLIRTPSLTLVEKADMRSVMWGKLLLNLNNALNALSGIPLQQQLESRAWRRVIADQMSEALSLLDAAGIEPEKAIALPPKYMPGIMRLPTPFFRLIAGRMLKIDPTARSSMWEDLQRGRPTEIDQLQGACVELAASVGRTAPICSRVTGLIRDAEAAQAGSPGLSPEQVMAA